jgi:flagellar hook-associated protein 1 FlgK
MRSSFMGLEVQKRSLQVAQKNIDITGHNINNIGTVGFTRQRVDSRSLHISSFTNWQTRLAKLSLAGQGVTAIGVSQIRNNYLDKRYRDEIPKVRELNVKINIMTELESALDNIDNEGLHKAFLDLKSAIERVALSQPDAREMCTQVRDQAVNISSMLRTYNNDLNRLLQNNIVELQESVRATNILIDKIVQYNIAITGEYLNDMPRIMRGDGVSEHGPLELLDARNLLLDELAQYGNIEVFQNVNGSVRVTMAGTTIIDDRQSTKITMQKYEDFNAAVLTFSNGDQFRPATGEIRAYMDMVNGNGPYSVGRFQNSEYGIPYYIQALNAFAAGFADLMNGVNHSHLGDELTWNRNLIWGGYELDDNGDRIRIQAVDGAGNLMVDTIDGSPIWVVDANGNPVWLKSAVTAANIRVSDEWIRNELMIAETFAATPADDFAAIAYNVGDVFFDPNSGSYFRVTAAFTVTDVDDGFDLNDVQRIGPYHGQWSVANLDGTNLSRFVKALEEDRRWGRSLDFNGSAFDYLKFLSNRLATGIDFMETQLDAQMDIVGTLLNNRDAISAVSESEEGINLLTYQKWFNASARLMTTMDEALDTIINRMGRVGL